MKKMLFGLSCVVLAMTVLVSCAPSATPTPAPAPQTATPARPITPKPTEEAAKPKPATATPEPPKPAGAPYYQGKTIDILCESAAGGGTDTIARITAALLPKYLPGNPRIVVRNQGGGAGVIANNTFYEKAKPDGTFLLQNSSSPTSMQMRSRDIVKYDLTKYKYVGCIIRGGNIIMIKKGLMGRLTDPKAPPLIVGTKEGEETWQAALLWGKEFLGWNLRWIPGYGGTSEIELAFRRGEVDVFGTSNAFIVRRMNEEGFTENVCAAGTKRRPDFPDIPTFVEVLGNKRPSGLPWQAFLSWMGAKDIDKFLVAPPGTPDNIMALLTDAFAKMAKDPKFDEMVKKAVTDVYDVEIGNTVLEMMKEVLDVPQEAIDYAKVLQKKAGIAIE